MELGNMLSLMLLVTKIVLTTIRPGQNNLCIHCIGCGTKIQIQIKHILSTHLCIHWAEVLLMRPLSQPAAQPQPDTAHSTEHSQHTAHSTHAQPQPDPGVDQTLRHMPATCHACPAFQFQLNFRQKNTNKQNTNPKPQPVASSLPPTPPYFASMHWIAQTALFFAFQLSFNRIIHK